MTDPQQPSVPPGVRVVAAAELKAQEFFACVVDGRPCRSVIALFPSRNGSPPKVACRAYGKRVDSGIASACKQQS